MGFQVIQQLFKRLKCRKVNIEKYYKKYTFHSWHEIGYYDLPAMIDYILEKTGHSELYFIGHSQGTTTFYVMLSERPEYNSKIKGMISLAPIAFLSNQRSPLFKYLVHFNDILEVMQFYNSFSREIIYLLLIVSVVSMLSLELLLFQLSTLPP